jgi:hypothetical protein
MVLNMRKLSAYFLKYILRNTVAHRISVNEEKKIELLVFPFLSQIILQTLRKCLFNMVVSFFLFLCPSISLFFLFLEVGVACEE